MKYLLLVDHQCIVTPARGLQKDTFSLSLPDRLRSQHSPDRLIKDLEISVDNCSVYSSTTALTCLSPLWVRAEHSRYLTARILFASFWPCSLLIGEWPLSARACSASLSSLRSILVPDKQNSVSLYLSLSTLPINKMGASGQWCLISGHHFEVTFSKEEGLTTEKQMRKTSVWG